MLLQKRISIEEAIVKVLARKVNLSVKEIISSLNQEGLSFSQRGVYKELNKLEEQGILLKSKYGYSLQLSWITNLLSFADAAYDIYSHPKYLEQLLSLGTKRTTHKFTKVGRLDQFWIQLMSSLSRLYPKEYLYLWCPYQWFNLLHPYNVNLFYQASDMTGTKRYHIMGDDNYLNQKALKTMPKLGEYSLRNSPFSNQMNTYFSVTGDVVLTIKFDSAFNNRIETLFDSVKSESDLKSYDLNSVFSPDIKGSLTLEKNEIKAKRIKKKFQEFFGISPTFNSN
jgi:hypothetical protein